MNGYFGSDIFSQRMRCGVFFALLLLISVGTGSFASAHPDGDPPIHGGMTRLDFERAKQVEPGSGLEKNGALGDAAAGSDRYDMLRHVLDLKIDPDLERIDGSVTFEFASRVENLQVFVLDLASSLNVDSIDSPAGSLTYTHDADSLSINLATALALNEEGSLTVHYSGFPVQPTYDRGLMFKTHRGVDGTPSAAPIVANLSEPAYAKYWWPCKDKPRDKALSEMILTVPDDLVGVSNGTLISQAPAADPGWETFHWQEVYPIASYLVSVAISDYLLLQSECETTLGVDLGYNIPLRNWVFPHDLEDAQVDFDPLCEMMEECEGWFGPYPFRGEKYGHAEFRWFGAMEHQTVTSIGESSLLGDGTRDWLIVHELGHQWFGDHLTPLNWRDIWLNEGFATYSEALWREYLDGHDAYLANLANGRSEDVWQRQGPVYDPVPVFPGGVIYDKGAWILHMLRGRIGDVAFFDLLGEWGRVGGRTSAVVGEDPFIGYSVTTEEFIALAEIYAGESLGDFFWPYLTETKSPEIVFSRTVEAGEAGPDTRLTIALRQVQSVLFDNIFPVVVTTTGGEVTRTIRLTDATTEAIWDFDDPILFATLDPEHWVLWKPASGVSSDLGITRLYPNPSNGDLLTLRYHLDQPSTVVFRVFDAAGREVLSRNLGRIEPEAGFNVLDWDQRDSQGAVLASGVFWATLEINGVRSVRKFTVIH